MLPVAERNQVSEDHQTGRVCLLSQRLHGKFRNTKRRRLRARRIAVEPPAAGSGCAGCPTWAAFRLARLLLDPRLSPRRAGTVSVMYSTNSAGCSNSRRCRRWPAQWRQPDRRVGLGGPVVALETFVVAPYGFHCPLTAVAQNPGGSPGAVTDKYLPQWLARNLPAIDVPLLITAAPLHWGNISTTRGESHGPSRSQLRGGPGQHLGRGGGSGTGIRWQGHLGGRRPEMR